MRGLLIGLVLAFGSLVCFVAAGNFVGVLIWCIVALGVLVLIVFLAPRKGRQKEVP